MFWILALGLLLIIDMLIYLNSKSMDFLDKYYKRKLIKTGKISFLFFRYSDEIDFEKNIIENLKVKKKDKQLSIHVSFRSFLFQLFNYLFTFWILILSILISIDYAYYEFLLENFEFIVKIYIFLQIVLMAILAFLTRKK